jgi:hypothetical protein
LEELATVVGTWVANERCLFETLGGWVREVADPGAKAMLAAHSRHHGWRSEVLATGVPIAVGIHAHDHVDSSVSALSSVTGDEARLQALYGDVLPAVIAGYRSWLAAAWPASDAALGRWIRLVVADAEHDLAEGLTSTERLWRGRSTLRA